MPTRDILAGADPDCVWPVGVDSHTADGIGILIIEQRRPGGAPVLGLPHAATADADVPCALSLRVDRDIRNAPGHESRADTAKLKSLECSLIKSRIDSLLVGSENGRERQRKIRDAENQTFHGDPLVLIVLAEGLCSLPGDNPQIHSFATLRPMENLFDVSGKVALVTG